jgi:hypothetical protein
MMSKKYKLTSNEEYLNKMMKGGNGMRLNPWPPIIGRELRFQNPNTGMWFQGKVISLINNRTICIIKLTDQKKKQYRDNTLSEYEKYNYGYGFSTLLANYRWGYTDINNFDPMISSHEDLIKNKEQQLLEIKNKKMLMNNIQRIRFNNYIDRLLKEKQQLLLNKLKEYDDDYIYNYVNNDSNVLNEDDRNELKIKLDEFKPLIKGKDTKIIVDKTIAIDNLITDVMFHNKSFEENVETSEYNEGSKIVQWIDRNLRAVKIGDDINNFLYDIITEIYNGYVYIARAKIDVTDIVTQDHFPEENKIKHYEWQLNKPIEYQTIKHDLLLTNYQHSVPVDKEMYGEIKSILALEYLIALQPKPEYQIWFLNRLILAWYADEELNNNIRKIMVVINQWRCTDNSVNRELGIMPSIVIFPKYGRKSTVIVLTRLNYYFSTYKNLGWVGNAPTYFKKIDNLIYYTNGSIELKQYYQKIIENYNPQKIINGYRKELTNFINLGNAVYDGAVNENDLNSKFY